MRLDDYIVQPDSAIMDILKKIDKNAKGIVYVCDENRKLLGAITDGDIRRFIIHSGKLDAKASQIMKTDPISVMECDIETASRVMRIRQVKSVPILDDSQHIVDVRFQDERSIIVKNKIDYPVVIMAGGMGTRLQPYTSILPKPLIPIGDKTITEHIIERFQNAGCKHFDMIVNYKKHFIKSYFRDLDKKPDIDFFEEDEFLGTAGGLRLLIGQYKGSFFMTNCDILIDADYSEIMDYHRKNGNIATIVCAVKNMKLPYGVIKTGDNGQVDSIVEKPDITSVVNTGFYVLTPEFLDQIPEGKFVHITEVLQTCIDKSLKVGMYPVSEDNWMDMGQMDELQKMTEKLGELR